MKPLQNLSAYCNAFSVADNQVELQQDHLAHTNAILEALKKQKVAKELQKLVQLDAPEEVRSKMNSFLQKLKNNS
ncbi:MAG: hypothetical protein GY822_31640 [Deltaproteobacteria bacterium]|nr:hypothetical protein [Deltaproteobacteria bacterium]